MLSAVGGNSVNAYIREVDNPEGEIKQQNISYKGNPNFERNPDYDYYDGEKKSGGKTAGTIVAIIGALVLGLGCGSYFKGKKMLENQESKFFEKIKTGGTELWNQFSSWVKNIFKKKP